MGKSTKFYTGADTSIFLEGKGGIIKLDTAKSIGFQERFSAGPIHGVGNEVFGFVNKGNLSINGFIELHLTDNEYMSTAISFATNGEGEATEYNATALNTLRKQFSKMPDEQIYALKEAIAKTYKNKELDSSHGIGSFESGFSIRLVFNNGNMVHRDINKTFLFKNVRILGSSLISAAGDDQPVSIRYDFIAQTLK